MYLLQIKPSPDWGSFFGHFHPVVVHLPIGILFIAFLLELVRLKTKNNQLNSVIVIIFFWGFVTAVVSCILGWLLSLPGDYDEDNLFWHQWLGIGVAVIAGLLWLIKKRAVTATRFTISKTFTALLLIMMALITFTGHLGGSMTHGEGYLTANTPQPFRDWLGISATEAKKEKKPITDVNEALIYADLIAPVMETTCWNCHNANKKKGKLRMDTETLLMKGGKHGVVIKPNDINGSEIIKRLLLPEGDDKRMPPKGKPGLNENEINLLKWWIASGASFTAKVKAVAKTAAVEPFFKNFATAHAAGSQNDRAAKESVLSPVFLQKIPAAGKAEIDALRKENLIINPVSQNQPFIELSAVNAPGFSDDKMKLVNKLSPQIVWLKLSGTKITDAGMKEISNCKNLVRLNIENSSVTNTSIAVIKQFAHLEYLNIVGTKIDDNGLLELAAVKSLKNIYCWQTGVTGKGAEAFKKINPDANIDFGEEKTKPAKQ